MRSNRCLDKPVNCQGKPRPKDVVRPAGLRADRVGLDARRAR